MFPAALPKFLLGTSKKPTLPPCNNFGTVTPYPSSMARKSSTHHQEHFQTILGKPSDNSKKLSRQCGKALAVMLEDHCRVEF
jgi:hypothetical protein